MENFNRKCFKELNLIEQCEVNGGGWSDFVDKVNPMNVVNFIYQAGQDFGAAGVKFGRECYDFYRDVRKIFR